MSVELKLCPFCGSEAKLYLGAFSIAYIMCLHCGVEGRTMNTPEEASAAWNTRILDARLLASNKKLVEALKLYQDRECSSGLRHINGNVPYLQADAALREAEAITKE